MTELSKEDIVRHAQIIVSDSQFDEEIVDLKAALELDPQNSTLHLRLGHLYDLKKDSKTAIECYLTSARLDLQHWYGDWSAATLYKWVLELDDSRADIQYALHGIYDEIGMTYISDQDMIEWLAAMRQFEGEGKLIEAIQATELLLKDDPHNPEVLIKLTELCMKIGDRDRGNVYFRQAIYQLMEKRMSPQTEELLVKLGEANPDNQVPPAELIRTLKEWLNHIQSFIDDYFPNKDPWENEREMGWREPEEFREEYLGRAKNLLEKGLTPMESFKKIKARLAEREKEYYRYLRKHLPESRYKEVH